MTFLQEAELRWKTAGPPFFNKVKQICASLIVFGTTVVGVSYPTKLAWMAIVGAAFVGAGTFGGAVAQLVVTNIGLIIPPGGSIENKTGAPIEVKPAIDIPVPDPTVETLPPPAAPGTP